jgi:hypothetical protein
VLRLGGVRLSVKCDEACGATTTAVVRITGHRGLSLARVVRQLRAHKRVKVTLKASRTTLRAIRSALRRHRRVTVKITVVGRDAAGNAGRATRTVRATL